MHAHWFSAPERLPPADDLQKCTNTKTKLIIAFGAAIFLVCVRLVWKSDLDSPLSLVNIGLFLVAGYLIFHYSAHLIREKK
jgi:hypothetical protein